MLRCVHSIHKSSLSTSRLVLLRCPSQPTPRFFHATTKVKSNKEEPILTELVYGRKRIYTSLQTIGKATAATPSKNSIASSPMSWEWIHTAEDSKETKKEWYQIKQKRGGFNFINSAKQNMREMFLPVGYPETVHDCYKKFHSWLFLETYVGSAVSNELAVCIHTKCNNTHKLFYR